MNKLGGRRENIHKLILEIHRWYKSDRSIVQLIKDDHIQNQPFQEIEILYRCQLTNSMERIYLNKHFPVQQQSTCRSQIQIGNRIHSFVMFNSTKSMNDPTDFNFNRTPKSFPWNFTVKVRFISLFINRLNCSSI